MSKRQGNLAGRQLKRRSGPYEVKLAMVEAKAHRKQAKLREALDAANAELQDLRQQVERLTTERDALESILHDMPKDANTDALERLRANLGAQRPWRVERDWAYEVTAADGTIVDKLATHEQAQDMCDSVNTPNPSAVLVAQSTTFGQACARFSARM